MRTSALLILAAGAALSAGQAAAETRSYTLAGFNKIVASNHVRVVLKQGPYAATVEEPYGRFEDLRMSVRDGVLTASRRDRFAWALIGHWDRPLYTITITAPAFSEIAVYDHARISAKVSAPVLKLMARDHGRLSGDFSAGNLDVSAADHGHISYAGRCSNLTVAAWDHGDIEGSRLTCDLVNARANDHGDLSVSAAKSISCEAYDHGDVWVHGPAAVIAWRVSDHGSIRRL